MLVALSAAVVGAAGLKINVEQKGTYIYWLGYTDGLGVDQVTQPERFKGKSAEIDVGVIGESVKNTKIYVMDKRSGNLAVADYTPSKDPKTAKPIDLKKEDFGYVRSVRLRAVAENNEPLESGVVTITDGEGTEMRSIVTPADMGIASFQNVASGEINVKVKAEGLTKTLDSDFELPASRQQPGFERDVKVAGDVNTLETAPVSGPQESKPVTPVERGGSRAGAVFQFLAGLMFLVVSIAVIAIILRGKGVALKNALRGLGANIPEDQPGSAQTPDVPAVDPNICQFCGQTRDASGKCACTLAPGAAPSAPSPQSAVAGPRLAGTQGMFAGHVFEISGASVTIGREDGNSVTLAGDSTTSRHHATISVVGADYILRDEGSSNGTFVNGARITEQKLSSGDEIQIGASKFRFEG